ncbi:MAG: hypothetical protein ABH832_02525 [bacterium]
MEAIMTDPKTSPLADTDELIELASKWLKEQGLQDGLEPTDVLEDEELRVGLVRDLQRRKALEKEQRIAEEERKERMKIAAKREAKEKLKQAMSRKEAELEKQEKPAIPVKEERVIDADQFVAIAKEYGSDLPDMVFENAEKMCALRGWLCKWASYYNKREDKEMVRKISDLIHPLNEILIKAFGFRDLNGIKSFRAKPATYYEIAAQAEAFEPFFFFLPDHVQVKQDTDSEAKVISSKLQCPSCKNWHRKLFYMPDDKGKLIDGFVDSHVSKFDAEEAGVKLACGKCRERVMNQKKKEAVELRKRDTAAQQRAEAARKKKVAERCGGAREGGGKGKKKGKGK